MWIQCVARTRLPSPRITDARGFLCHNATTQTFTADAHLGRFRSRAGQPISPYHITCTTQHTKHTKHTKRSIWALCCAVLHCAALRCTTAHVYIYIYIHTYQHACLPDIPGRYPPSPRPIPSRLISSHARGPNARLIPNATEPCVETPPSNNGNHNHNHNHNQNHNHNPRKTKHDMQIKQK
jgi:hypothetical protein